MASTICKKQRGLKALVGACFIWKHEEMRAEILTSKVAKTKGFGVRHAAAGKRKRKGPANHRQPAKIYRTGEGWPDRGGQGC